MSNTLPPPTSAGNWRNASPTPKGQRYACSSARIARHAVPHAQEQILYVLDGIARVDYPRLGRASSGEPLCGSQIAQPTTALCAGANALVYLVLICQCAFPTRSSGHVLTCDLSFGCGMYDIHLLPRLGLNLHPCVQAIDTEYRLQSLKEPTDCFHEFHEKY
jgi:hypothetical protein